VTFQPSAASARSLRAHTGDGDNVPPPVRLLDAPFMCPIYSTCNPLTQAGCSTDSERCAVVIDTSECPVPVGCVPIGPVPIGEACSFAMASEHVLADDCGVGAICEQGTCRQICNPSGGMPACPGFERCEADAAVAHVGSCSL
jgi:hypothetical protein